MKPQTEIGRGKPTIKIAKGKGSKFLLYSRVESLYFGAWMVAVAGSVPGLLSLTAVSGPERRPMLDQGMKDLMETSHLHQVNQGINKLDAYLLSYTPHTVKCRALLLEPRTCPVADGNQDGLEGCQSELALRAGHCSLPSCIHMLQSLQIKTLPFFVFVQVLEWP